MIIIAGLNAKSILNFVRKLPNYFPKQLYHFIYAAVVYESPSSPISLPTLGMVSLLTLNHSNGYEVVY